VQGLVELGLLLSGVFGAGLYIAVSPCLFPLLPLFLINNLQSANSRKRSLLVTTILVIGILSSIAILIVVLKIVGFIGTFILGNYRTLQGILGIFIVFLGIVMISPTLQKKLRLSSLSLKSQPSAPRNLLNVFSVGFGYSILAYPCSGTAILGTIAIFGAGASIFFDVFLFVVLSIAIALPYLLIALVTGEARMKMAMTISNKARTIELAAGIILVLIGLFLVYQGIIPLLMT
jgi:cytochrome c biogenesis protein CcdA